MCVCGGAVCACLGNMRSEDNLLDLHHVGPRDGNQVVRVAEPSRQPTSHFHAGA